MPDEDYDYGDDNGGGGGRQDDERLDRFEGRLREVTEAISNLSRTQETRDIRSRIAQRSSEIENVVRAAERDVDQAEQALADAYEAGDGAVIARAQRELSERIANREHARISKRDHDNAVRELERRNGGAQGAPRMAGQQQQQRPEAAKDTTNLDKWKDRHSSWYGIDGDMTKAAHEIDRSIREAGVIPVGSAQYFEAIDRQMSRRFPEQLRHTPDTGAGGGGRHQPQQQMRPGTGRIPRDVIDGWERMGIDVSKPETLERMIKNRSTLADKGILPTEPAYGIVRPR